MGMDVYGKNPKSDDNYFRNNCWWWRPLWDYCKIAAPHLINSEIHQAGMYNDGQGLEAHEAKELAVCLREAIASGATKEYETNYMSELNALPDKECWLCHGTGKRTDMVVQNGCNCCQGKGVVRPDACSYPFSVENVQEFAEFCEKSGGFEIW
jgi:hypothetical protein